MTTLVLGGTGKTGRRVVERLSARGLPVRVGSRSGEPRFDIPVSRQAYEWWLSRDPVLADRAQALADLFAKVMDGRNARLTDGVRRVLGRAPRDFRDFAQAAAVTGVWNGGAP